MPQQAILNTSLGISISCFQSCLPVSGFSATVVLWVVTYITPSNTIGCDS